MVPCTKKYYMDYKLVFKNYFYVLKNKNFLKKSLKNFFEKKSLFVDKMSQFYYNNRIRFLGRNL